MIESVSSMCSSSPSDLPISSSVSPSQHHATRVSPASSTPSTCANSFIAFRNGPTFSWNAWKKPRRRSAR